MAAQVAAVNPVASERCVFAPDFLTRFAKQCLLLLNLRSQARTGNRLAHDPFKLSQHQVRA
jgi:hypothetical protein